MAKATVRITEIRPSNEIDWYIFTLEEKEYYLSKYSQFTHNTTFVSNGEYQMGDLGIEIPISIINGRTPHYKKIRSITGDKPLILEFYSDVNNTPSSIYSNKSYFETNNIEFIVELIED